jgi:retron-type reverse transcriptase
MCIIRRKIKDKATCNLISKLFRSKYWGTSNGLVDFNLTSASEYDTHQSSIITPLFTNIFLHELDAYVQEIIIPLYTREKTLKSTRNLKHQMIVNQYSENSI